MSRRSRSSLPAAAGDPLDADALLAAIPGDVAERIERLDVFASLDSTNRYLLDAPPPSAGALRLALADFQHAGRGRRGRRWSAPPGTGLCLSAALELSPAPRGLPALPLATGVAARRAIASVCGVEVGLKWPNDLVWANRKLGGILVERAARAGGGAHVVIGIGINVAVPPEMLPTLADGPDGPNGSNGAVDLAEATAGQPPARVALAAVLIAELADLAARFARHGFAAYQDEFAGADALRDRVVQVVDDEATMHGVARGIDVDGALIVDGADGSRRRLLAGDVSVKPSAEAGAVPR